MISKSAVDDSFRVEVGIDIFDATSKQPSLTLQDICGSRFI
jgi:hypothetical protein